MLFNLSKSDEQKFPNALLKEEEFAASKRKPFTPGMTISLAPNSDEDISAKPCDDASNNVIGNDSIKENEIRASASL
ncbi:hypothetical protein JCM19239_3927 [Vibrio variabilis]|uniref:Uncharacterized protein n=1 Tax=Vibrio variabilis TaxID=990271 RepID=A0ABQ0J629_9VIBR|nr:hypothetical protein JCM19239_3927 [Vibrio variabilis]